MKVVKTMLCVTGLFGVLIFTDLNTQAYACGCDSNVSTDQVGDHNNSESSQPDVKKPQNETPPKDASSGEGFKCHQKQTEPSDQQGESGSNGQSDHDDDFWKDLEKP